MVLVAHANLPVIMLYEHIQTLTSTRNIIGNTHKSCFLPSILLEKFTWKIFLDHFQVQLRKYACGRIGAEWRMFGGARRPSGARL